MEQFKFKYKHKSVSFLCSSEISNFLPFFLSFHFKKKTPFFTKHQQMESETTDAIEKAETSEGSYPQYAEIIRSVVADLSHAVARNKVGPEQLLDFVADFFHERKELQRWRRYVSVEESVCMCLYDRLMRSKDIVVSMEVLSLNSELCGIHESLLDALQTMFGWTSASKVDWRVFLFAVMMFSGESVGSCVERVMGVFPDGRVSWEVVEMWMDLLAQVDKRWEKQVETGGEMIGEWRREIDGLKESGDGGEGGVAWIDLAPAFQEKKD
jgi:hypothetical protein